MSVPYITMGGMLPLRSSPQNSDRVRMAPCASLPAKAKSVAVRGSRGPWAPETVRHAEKMLEPTSSHATDPLHIPSAPLLLIFIVCHEHITATLFLGPILSLLLGRAAGQPCSMQSSGEMSRSRAAAAAETHTTVRGDREHLAPHELLWLIAMAKCILQQAEAAHRIAGAVC